MSEWDVTNTGQPHSETTFTISEGTWMSVDVSPDGRTLVFDLLGDIYALPATGGEATLLHGGPAIETQPRFSPDGSKIVYISDKGGSDNLWISNADGSNARQISHETVNVLASPAWTADGQYAAASKFYPKVDKLFASEIWLYHLNGGQGRLLVEIPKSGRAVNEVTFSRNGHSAYYTENVSASTFMFVNANQPIYAMKRRNLRSGEVEEVVCGFGSATSSQISPDEKRIAFIRRVKEKTVLFVYDTETGEQRPIDDGLERDLHAHWNPRMGGYYPHYAWFPDGRHLALWMQGKLYKVDTQTRTKHEIPFRVTAHHHITIPARFEHELAPESFVVRAIQQVAVAPGGREIAFNALGRLWGKSIPNGEPKRCTSTTDFEFDPCYSPDGASMAFVSWNDETGGALQLLDLRSGTVKALLHDVGIVRQPSFSPDGKHLVYRIESGNNKMGGYRGKAGLYCTPIAKCNPKYIAPEGKYPQFSPDGKRIYYTDKVAGFFGLGGETIAGSVTVDGRDKRVHVVTNEVEELRISPNLRWLSYKKDLQYYVIPYCEVGAALQLTKAGSEMPVIKLTELSGYELTWSADSQRVNWLLGDTFLSAEINESVLVTGNAAATMVTIGLQVPVDKPAGTIAFTNARIITMQEDEVIECGTLVVTGNHIAAVGTSERVEVPKDATVIDATGKTLMPGLIDMHGHANFVKGEFLTSQKHPNHYALLAFGVTTNFDPSAPDLTSFADTESNLAGVTAGPRYISTGKIIYGLDSVGAYNPIETFEDARKILSRKKALGAIIIKNYMQPRRSQRQQLIKAAREAGIMITPEGEGHFYNNISMVLDGHVSVEHNFPLANYYDDVIQLLAHGGTSVTPTLVVTNGETFGENYFYATTRPWDDPKIAKYVHKTFSEYSPLGSASEAPPYARGMIGLYQADELWEKGFRSVARSQKKLDDAGVVVNVGGHGQIQGLATHWEMWALAEGGMSNLRVLKAGTINGAKTIGLDKQVGTLEAGKLADLLVLDANPLENIRNTNTVRYTMINGRLYDSLTMNEVGNYDRARTKFYWELPDYGGIDWNESWGGSASHSETSSPSCCFQA